MTEIEQMRSPMRAVPCPPVNLQGRRSQPSLFVLLSLARRARFAWPWQFEIPMLFAFTAACIGGYLVSAVIDTVQWRHIWLFLALAWAGRREIPNPQFSAAVSLWRRSLPDRKAG